MLKIALFFRYLIKISIIFAICFSGLVLYSYQTYKIETTSTHATESEMHIAFGINDVYAMPLCTTITSLLWNNRRPIHIYIMHETLSEENQQKLKTVVKYFPNTNITFLPIYIPDDFKQLYNPQLFSKDIFSRVNLPNLLPHLNKVLYLDADIIINGNLSPLYNTDLHEFELAAVRDTRADYHIKRLNNFNITDYVFSGSLLMNLKKMRDTHATERIYTFLFQNLTNYNLFLPEQDAINIVLKDKILVVDSIWNADMRQRQALKSIVLHYPMAKPWLVNHFQGFYWHKYNDITMQILTNSKNDIMMFIDYTLLKIYQPFFHLKNIISECIINPFITFFANGIYHTIF